MRSHKSGSGVSGGRLSAPSLPQRGSDAAGGQTVLHQNPTDRLAAAQHRKRLVEALFPEQVVGEVVVRHRPGKAAMTRRRHPGGSQDEPFSSDQVPKSRTKSDGGASGRSCVGLSCPVSLNRQSGSFALVGIGRPQINRPHCRGISREAPRHVGLLTAVLGRPGACVQTSPGSCLASLDPSGRAIVPAMPAFKLDSRLGP